MYLCNELQTSWLQSNWVGLLTIIVAAAFVIWQTLYTIHFQRRTALANQRYEIFQQTDELLQHYIVLNDPRQFGPSQRNPYLIRRAILLLLAQPTTMPRTEMSLILSTIRNSVNLPAGEAVQLVGILHKVLSNKLNPALTPVMHDIDSRAMTS
jgi:hypothetical protein